MTKTRTNTGQNSNKKVLSITHLLYPYVKQRIRVGENLGFFPRNMYKSNEIIDEVVLDTYEKGYHKSMDSDNLRLAMFDLVNKRMGTLFATEEWHKNTISTKLLLEMELEKLEENFTVDADNDLIMNEELDDISYHQNDADKTELPYDRDREEVMSFLGLDRIRRFEENNDRKALRKIYYKLPVNTSNIVDLYILGKLSFHEIAEILKMKASEVKEIVSLVRETIKKQLE